DIAALLVMAGIGAAWFKGRSSLLTHIENGLHNGKPEALKEQILKDQAKKKDYWTTDKPAKIEELNKEVAKALENYKAVRTEHGWFAEATKKAQLKLEEQRHRLKGLEQTTFEEEPIVAITSFKVPGSKTSDGSESHQTGVGFNNGLHAEKSNEESAFAFKYNVDTGHVPQMLSHIPFWRYVWIGLTGLK
ncbi:MAG TPA: hypothetical protein V6C96_02900, partial [Vampirovibrionales bacterium]